MWPTDYSLGLVGALGVKILELLQLAHCRALLNQQYLWYVCIYVDFSCLVWNKVFDVTDFQSVSVLATKSQPIFFLISVCN